MENAVARYCEATEAQDMTALAATLAPDVELPSPLFRSMTFKGRDDVVALLGAVYATLSKTSWEPAVGEGRVWFAIAEARVGGVRISDAMGFELDEQGLIRRIRPHLRSLLAILIFAVLVPPRLASRPGIVLRALRA
jgi:hypothetical protein